MFTIYRPHIRSDHKLRDEYNSARESIYRSFGISELVIQRIAAPWLIRCCGMATHSMDGINRYYIYEQILF